MAINPYDKWPDLNLKPLDFGQLMQAQALINKAKDDKLDRDLKAYDDISKLKTTHVQMIPGSVDEARQQAVEKEQFARLDDLVDKFSKNQIDYKTTMMGLMDIRNNIVSPDASIGNEQFKNWTKSKDVLQQMQATGKGYSPALHANFLSGAGFDSSKGDRWDKLPQAYLGAEVVETLYNNLTPIEDASGWGIISAADIKKHTIANMPLIMNEPFTYQQIQIARSKGDKRSDSEIAYDVWYNKGLEFVQKKIDLVGRSAGTTGYGPPAAPAEVPTEVPKSWGLSGFTPDTLDEFNAKKNFLRTDIASKKASLLDVSRDPNSDATISKMAGNRGIKYIKLPDGHIYRKEDVTSNKADKMIMDGVYDVEVETPLKQSEDQLAVVQGDTEQILRNLMENEYGLGSYNTKRPTMLDRDGNYIFSGNEKAAVEDSNFWTYYTNMLPILRDPAFASKYPALANEAKQRMALTDATVPESLSFLKRVQTTIGPNPVLDPYIHKIETELKDASPEYQKYAGLFKKYYDQYYNPPVSFQPQGHIFNTDDKIKTQLPLNVQGFNIARANGEIIKDPKDIDALSKNPMEIVSWAMLPKEGVVVEAISKGKDGKLGETFYIDISGAYENAFLKSRGLIGQQNQVIDEQVNRLFTNPIASQSGKILIDGKEYYVTTKEGKKYVGYVNDINRDKNGKGTYEQIPIGAVNNVALSSILKELSGSQALYSLDRLTSGISYPAFANTPGGVYQIDIANNADVLQKLGFKNPYDPKFSLSKVGLDVQAKIARDIIRKVQPRAFDLYSTYGKMPSSPLKTLEDFTWAAYYLGADGLDSWLKAFNTSGPRAANKTIKNRTATLEALLGRSLTEADKYSNEMSRKYNKK